MLSSTMDEKRASAASSAGRTSLRRRHYVEGALIIFFWGALALLKVTQHATDGVGPFGRPAPAGLIPYIFLQYGLWIIATPIAFWLAARFSPEGRRWPLHSLVHLAAAVAVPVVIDLSSHAIWNAVVDARPRTVSLAAVVDDFHFLAELLLYLFVLATGFARSFFFRYRERLVETTRLRAEAAELQAHSAGLQAQLSEAHLQALRMQLNPHFLFNTLNAVSAYLERDPAGARRMIARLSELLRYALEKRDVREVPLQQELDFIEKYLDLQRVRFEERLELGRDVDEAVLDALVPTLILQPLVENAIKHGIGDREEGGRIALRAWREGQHLHLIVHDDGPGLSGVGGDGESTESWGIGLKNTRERLSSLYGSGQRFALEPADGGGLNAHIVLPYHTASDLYTSVVNGEEPTTSAELPAPHPDPRAS